uniref:Reverse transcriptase/retrotransposon-derived protein RNase H-like domain-containing protein n=1 Tax=Lactuca sativa TaxID=4236 RepID=A0A9R1VTI0_LACSA|nr:hypothetical protein LSAT_V11C400178100 [Lactuca sativa]
MYARDAKGKVPRSCHNHGKNRSKIEKVEALLKAQTQKTVKVIHGLNGKLAALGRFLVKSIEHTLPFFQELKTHARKNNIEWLGEAKEALQKLKKHLLSLLTFTSPDANELLIIHLSAS